MLNPVRAGIAESPEECAWSATGQPLGKQKSWDFLTTDWLLSRFDDKRGKAQADSPTL